MFDNTYKSIVVSIVLLVALSGCATLTATLYPVEGPLAQQTPPPVLTATVDGITEGTGNITLVMPDGEACKGRWSTIAPRAVGVTIAQAAGSVSTPMGPVWSTVYGTGVSVGNVPGVVKGEAVLVGAQGTVIQAEFYTGSGSGHGTGVATDNRGNVYKVLF